MMTYTYKDFEQLYIGQSDFAVLVLVGPSPETKLIKSEMLRFNEGGSYAAYIVIGDDVEIGENYVKVASFSEWMKVYDDRDKIAKFGGKEINVYWAAEYDGCIIQCIGENDCGRCGTYRQGR